MTDKEIATTILGQLGGNKFVTMTGSRDFLAIKNGLRMSLVRNISGANRLEITLNFLDTYDLRFYKYSPGRLNKKTFAYTDDKVTEIAALNEIYCDQLQDIFTSITELYTHL
jgi:hypothetical protein